MSTRGVYGFRKNGQDKLTYNHSDSYPDCLGRTMLEFCRDVSIEDLDKLYDLIEVINEDIPPTKEQIKICRDNGYANFKVSNQNEKDWYCLLYNLQGNFDAYRLAIKKNQYLFMIDSNDFIKDSLFCEYGYIINLDNESLEFYVGFQKHPQKGNRYGTQIHDGYYPCMFAMNIPLYIIKNEATINMLVNKMNKIEDEDDD